MMMKQVMVEEVEMDNEVSMEAREKMVSPAIE
jgi:hypothetical protein